MSAKKSECDKVHQAICALSSCHNSLRLNWECLLEIKKPCRIKWLPALLASPSKPDISSLIWSHTRVKAKMSQCKSLASPAISLHRHWHGRSMADLQFTGSEPISSCIGSRSLDAEGTHGCASECDRDDRLFSIFKYYILQNIAICSVSNRITFSTRSCSFDAHVCTKYGNKRSLCLMTSNATASLSLFPSRMC
jgi:hypothetical protein